MFSFASSFQSWRPWGGTKTFLKGPAGSFFQILNMQQKPQTNNRKGLQSDSLYEWGWWIEKTNAEGSSQPHHRHLHSWMIMRRSETTKTTSRGQDNSNMETNGLSTRWAWGRLAKVKTWNVAGQSTPSRCETSITQKDCSARNYKFFLFCLIKTMNSSTGNLIRSAHTSRMATNPTLLA